MLILGKIRHRFRFLTSPILKIGPALKTSRMSLSVSSININTQTSFVRQVFSIPSLLICRVGLLGLLLICSSVGWSQTTYAPVHTETPDNLFIFMPPAPPPGSNSEAIGWVLQGDRGYDGRDAGCNKAPGGGGDGYTPPPIVQTLNERYTYSEEDAIVYVSRGGNGGNGGDGGDQGLPCGGTYNGRTGGKGAKGGDIDVTFNPATEVNKKSFLHTGAYAYTGIFLQSLGGNGGNGGDNGGNGGSGAVGGTVKLTNNVSINTYYAGGYGILAQSLGGWGGSGAAASGIFWAGNGGVGSIGASGGDLIIVNSGNLNTPYGTPIFAQSMGGKGGDGGGSTALFAGSGGTGGYGGPGGNVAVLNSGNLTSSMTGGFGIFAQSMGGGGGAGGSAAGIYALGANGGEAASAGYVAVTNTGNISLKGASSSGIFAQSVGGGGGAGGMATGIITVGGTGGDGGAAHGVVASNTGLISTGNACSETDNVGRCVGRWNIAPTNGGSFGILAQSIGGGGGLGGIGISSSFGSIISVAIAGSGGKGGSGDYVYVNNSGSIATNEVNSAAILAQSVGGGGGSGGGAIGATASFFLGLGYSKSGEGGTAGDGGKVGINCPSFSYKEQCSNSGLINLQPPSHSAYILTSGISSPGILAQSIGGGGGSGGFAVSASASTSFSASLAYGGSGNAAGDGNKVFASPNGVAITTYGSNSPGILASSIGGGGGNGGDTVSGSLGLDASISISMGGKSGKGGKGDEVVIENINNGAIAAGPISTSGDRSHGLIAQSIGGGGGSGGTSITGSLGTGALNIDIGGSARSGMEGGTSTVKNDGQINTSGFASSAIVSQSIGGGGGNGGASISGSVAEVNAIFSVGGDSGSGANGQTATVLNSGKLISTGGGSPVILAQSIGGGGGNGGISVLGNTSFSGITANIGGVGASGGKGGQVVVSNSGDIESKSTNSISNSPGILAQSIGGGGGDGGLVVSGSVNATASLMINVGRTGGEGGKSDEVKVDNNAGITTSGLYSAGIVAQSIGGAGGMGGVSIGGGFSSNSSIQTNIGGEGSNGGESGIVSVSNQGQIHTTGAHSIGLIAQSIGGTGGNGGSAIGDSATVGGGLEVNIGNSGGAGGRSKAVNVELSGGVKTQGDQSIAVLAQSIGASGGNGGNAIASSLSTDTSGNISVGGAGRGGGTSGIVTIDINSASIITSGLISAGIIGQSIGGSGGNGGNSQSIVITSPGGIGTYAASASVGGSGGSGGTSNSVTITQTGTVDTAGGSEKSVATDGSIGIVAQSIGGNGGNGGNATSNAIAGGGTVSLSIGGPGNSGATATGMVSVSSNEGSTSGGIRTGGSNAPAILAQSIGGSGGNGGWSQSSSSSNKNAVSGSIGGSGGSGTASSGVYVGVGGLITTTGMQSSGIVAQSIGGGGGNGGSSSSQSASSPGSAVNGVTAAIGNAVASTGGNNSAVDIATWATSKSLDRWAPIENTPDSGISGSLGVGGLGGVGGASGWVALNNIATIITTGALSNGIVAQAIGGGGGSGGSSTTGADGGKYSASFSVGGYGETGGISGPVSVNNWGPISTTGNQSIGIYAQSIGGGGGGGGGSSSSTTAGAGGVAAVSLGVGGTGANGGTGGDVTVRNAGTIQTSGINSAGVYAQSVGGGGGNGGSSSVSSNVAAAENDSGSSDASTGGSSKIDQNASSNSSTAGNTAPGEHGADPTHMNTAAGSNRGTAVGITIGGFGGSGGTGGEVNIVNSSTIITGYQESSDDLLRHAALGLSDGSIGIFAQSVGGGGGDGGSTTSNADGSKNSLSMALGGFGGTGGNAGVVGVDNSGAVITYGNNSSAIFAQSVGGGGGNGGSSAVTAGTGGNHAIALGIGGQGSAAGDGIGVMVNNRGYIETHGALSYGIFAQSVGGGGGNGGDVSAASTAGTSSDNGESNSAITNSDGSTSSQAKSGVSIAASLGGSGGSGGNAGMITVTNSGSIETGGIGSTAIIAQSIGGGGGNSGSSSSESNSGAYNANFALGLKGGSGGAGKDVAVNTTGSIVTSKANAMGIFAQSVGGGGGSAMSSSSTSSGSSGKAGVAFSMGANGGSGNVGGNVTVSLNGTVQTQGANAIAVLAQSIGGGGGNGASSQSSANGGDAAVSISLGGSGGSGGNGSSVNVYALQSIGTHGPNAQALLAQSIGGGGGNGGSSSSTSGEGGKFNAMLSLGGSGSAAGDGGSVTVSTDVSDYNQANKTSLSAPNDVQSIMTRGVNSQGILAQSIGGGGGNGGDSSSLTNNSDDKKSTKAVGLSLGGQASSGGNGLEVNVNNTLSVTTTGAISQAILAQSIGGGGGNGGSSSSGPADNASTFNLALGAAGSGGGNGSTVNVTSSGKLTTAGLNSSALVAQSIGGGGGMAGWTDNNSFGYASSIINSYLGASNGVSGNSGVVNVKTSSGGEIFTTGINSMGIVAQSISGGGGITNSALSYKSGVVNYSVGLGGDGVAGANANRVEVNSSSKITTGTAPTTSGSNSTTGTSTTLSGANSVGILAQSIGGGGGISSTVVTGGSMTLNPSYIGGQTYTSGSTSVGTSGDGRDVTVNQMGAITNYGPSAVGIVAQSVGGGGGYATLASVTSTSAVAAGSLTIGGTKQSSGNGGNVNVTVDAPIVTNGANSVGVIAQSVGGGGGVMLTSGLNGNVTPDFSGGSGSGGKVTVNVNAPISIYGSGVYGVIAQSMGGGGGMVISESGLQDGSGKGGGEGSEVTVNVKSSIYVQGLNSSISGLTIDSNTDWKVQEAVGVYAKSIGTSDPTITVAKGSAIFASGGATGVVLDGLSNQLTNYGSIVALNPATDRAVKVIEQGGSTEIYNNGLISGALSNAGSNINILNDREGRFYLPSMPNLGNGVFTNSGYLMFNHPGEVATSKTNHTGSFIQTSTGILGSRIDFAAGKSDLLDISNSTQFVLDGKIRPVLINIGSIKPGSLTTTLITSDAFTGLAGISNTLGVDEQSAIMSYALNWVGNSINMVSTANFAPAGLSQFGSQVGQAIGSYQSAGSNAFFQAATAQLVEQPTVASLDNAYQGLAGTAIQAVPQVMYQAVSQGIGSYTDRINDWRVSTSTSKSSRMAAFNQPKRYAMGKTGNSLVDAANDDVIIGGGRSGPWVSLFQSNVFSKSLTDRIIGGTIAYELENDRRDIMGGLGVTLSQSGYSYNSAPTPITPGNTTNVGLSFYGVGRGEQAYITGTGYLGGGNSNFTRQLQTMNFYSNTNVNIMSYVAAGRVEAGYDFEPFRREHSNMKVTPFVAVQPTYIHQKGAQENFSGLGPGFNYSATDNTAVPVFAGLELSGNHMTEGGTKISPFIRASWMAETQKNGQMGANFNGNQGVNVFFNGSPNLGNAMMYKAGSVLGGERMSGYFTLDYDYGNASYSYRNYGVTGGIKYAF